MQDIAAAKPCRLLKTIISRDIFPTSDSTKIVAMALCIIRKRMNTSAAREHICRLKN
jgi:hypothetical protein